METTPYTELCGEHHDLFLDVRSSASRILSEGHTEESIEKCTTFQELDKAIMEMCMCTSYEVILELVYDLVDYNPELIIEIMKKLYIMNDYRRRVVCPMDEMLKRLEHNFARRLPIRFRRCNDLIVHTRDEIIEIPRERSFTYELKEFKENNARTSEVLKYLDTVHELITYPRLLKNFLWLGWKFFELTNNDLIGVKDVESFNARVKKEFMDGACIDILFEYPYLHKFTEMERAEMLIASHDYASSLEDIFMFLFDSKIEDEDVKKYLLEKGDAEMKKFIYHELY